MYERFYGFEERPFTLLPDPDFLFLSEKHRTALDLLELAIFNSSGFCVISGEIGAGKTTLIRELLNRLDENINVGLVSNTHESFGELLQWVMAAYGLPVGSSDKLELHRRFIDYTIEQYAGNKHTLLIIDEAQNLSLPALEELRMLSNVNSDKDLVLQVILVGQQQLRDKLRDPRLEQFSQRIALDYHLATLSEEETRRYIQHRLQRAGGRIDLFSDSACIVVYRVTHGIPRLINRVCDLSLVYGYSKESPHITAELVEQVAEDQRLGRLFGDDEMPLANEVQQPVTLKAVAGGHGFAAEPDMTTAAAPPLEADTRTEECEPVHTSSDDSGLISEVPEEATEPQATEEHSFPMNKNKITPASAEKVMGGKSDTIVDVMNSILPPDDHSENRRNAADVPAQPSRTEMADELRTLVVNAENSRKAKGERGALWLLLGVLAMVGGTGWMARDIWLDQIPPTVRQANVQTESAPSKRERTKPVEKPVVTVAEKAVEETAPAVVAQPGAVASGKPVKASPAAVAGQQVEQPEQPEQPLVETAAALESGKRLVRQDDGRLLETGEVRETIDPLAQDAELRQEAERLARLQEEAQRLEAERKAAERKLAEQRAARQALERKARREQQRIQAAKKAVDKVADDRARVEKKMREVTQAKVVETAPAAVPAVVVPAHGLADAPQASTGETVAVLESEEVEKEAVQAGEIKFSNNPCSGPTAKFLSTCR